MVGAIGALMSGEMSAPEYDRAATFALTLVSAWREGDKKGVEKILNDIRDVARNNAEVYDKASKALTELSKRQGKVEKDLAARLAEVERQEMAASEQVLSARSMADNAAKRVAELDAALDARAKIITEAEKKIAEAHQDLDNLGSGLEKQKQALEKRASDLAKDEASLAARIQKAENAIAGLQKAAASVLEL